MALLLLITVCFTVASAQTATMTHPEKLSISTQMFLDELDGKINFDNTSNERLYMPGQSRLLKPVERRYAAPEMIDGKMYISAFVWVGDDGDVVLMENEGVIVEERFDEGLMTTLIPVDRINEVAAIAGVKRIEVASMMQPATDEARRTTFVNDVLGYTDAAVEAGLPGMYDGDGVIVGVIDRGIDFGHIAFQDKDGNTRIKRAYVYNGSSAIYYYGEGPLPKDNVTNRVRRGRHGHRWSP